MVVSLRFGARGAIGETLSRNALSKPETCDRCKPMRGKLNETGTLVSDRVHLGEIAVIPGVSGFGRAAAFRRIACRSPTAPI
jgi:hypothetical protein